LQASASDYNLWSSAVPAPGQERLQLLLQAKGLQLELVHPCAAKTPPGQWYDQPMGEWVALLTGSALLRFADEACDGGGGCLWLTLFIDPQLLLPPQIHRFKNVVFPIREAIN
jgi:cupin 2 domain-containing protein